MSALSSLLDDLLNGAHNLGLLRGRQDAMGIAHHLTDPLAAMAQGCEAGFTAWPCFRLQSDEGCEDQRR